MLREQQDDDDEEISHDDSIIDGLASLAAILADDITCPRTNLKAPKGNAVHNAHAEADPDKRSKDCVEEGSKEVSDLLINSC